MRPLDKVTGVKSSGFGHTGAAGRLTWNPVEEATSYEVVVKRLKRWRDRHKIEIVLRVTVSESWCDVPNGFSTDQYVIEVRAKNEVDAGPWSLVQRLIVPLGPVQNLRVAATTVGEAGRVFWSPVAEAVVYTVVLRQIRPKTSRPFVLAVWSKGTSYVLPKSLPVAEYEVRVGALRGPAQLASAVQHVSWSVNPLPAAVESFTSEVAAVANGQTVSVTVRDSKLKVLKTFSDLSDLGVFLTNLPAGTYSNVVRSGAVSQVVRFVKPHASPLVSVVSGRLTVDAPDGAALNPIVQTAMLMVPDNHDGPLPPVLFKGRAIAFALPSSFIAGKVYVRLMFADGSESDWAIVAV